jgi:protein-L-isoaspartate(D-aspartate) O-methyltransferase
MPPDSEVHLARLRMVRDLERHGIRDRRVLDAMSRVPRERFVNVARPADAYANRALAIDCEQTISQPLIVAMMSETLELAGHETVLDIGTGSGYQTAILAELAARVISLEVHGELSARAGRVLTELNYQNVKLLVGDGTQGWPDEAPYRGILVAAATTTCPPALLNQLAEGGRLAIPLGSPSGQTLERIERHGETYHRLELTKCRFVPLVGGGTHES